VVSKNKHKPLKPKQKTPTYNTTSYPPNTIKLHIETNINIPTNKMIEIITTKPYIRHNTYHPFQISINLNTIERNKIITQTNNKPPKSTHI
jgi:hypothetical protein